jgi:hypothetical protein
LDLRALPNRRGSWRHTRVGPCGSYGDSARLLATRPPGSWRRSTARSAVARGVSWPTRAWVVGARLLAGAAPLKLAQGGGTGDLRGGWDWVGFRAGSKRKQKTIRWSHFAVVVIVISVESSPKLILLCFSASCVAWASDDFLCSGSSFSKSALRLGFRLLRSGS